MKTKLSRGAVTFGTQLARPPATIKMDGTVEVDGDVLVKRGDGVAWQKVATEEDIGNAKEVAMLLLRERNGDKAASAMLDRLAEDITIPHAAFFEIMRIVEDNVEPYNYNLDCEDFVATVRTRPGQYKITVKSASVEIQPSSSKGRRGDRARHRTLMLADPKVFEKIETFVKEKHE